MGYKTAELARPSSILCKLILRRFAPHKLTFDRGNDKENDRMAYDSIMSERALREVYLMPFMLAQRLAQPWSYMTA
jgi:hypothetical protein